MTTWVSMPDLSSILGGDLALVLARSRGGVSVYVPYTATAAHDLARLVGVKGMEALCAEFGGENIVVPNARRDPNKSRILALLRKGMSKRTIAMECRVTERYVYHLAGLHSTDQETPEPQQLTLR